MTMWKTNLFFLVTFLMVFFSPLLVRRLNRFLCNVYR